MKKLLFVVLALLLCAGLVVAQEPIYDHFVYLPMVAGGSGTVVPTETPEPTETATPTTEPTLTPTETLIPSETPTMTPTPTPQELLNGDFENGSDGSWTEHYEWPAHWLPLVNTFMQLWGIPEVEGHGSWLGWLGGANAEPGMGGGWEIVTAIEQPVTVPLGEGTLQWDVFLCFEYQIYSEDWWDYGGDTAEVSFGGHTLASWDVIFSNDGDWVEMCVDLDAWRGETGLLRFEMVNDHIWRGDFYVDNVEFQVTSWNN